MGYDVVLIEEKISVGTSATVTPDLVAYSDRHSHAIVADCKSGHSIRPHQDGLYAALSASDLYTWIDTAGLKSPMHVACYVVNSSNHAALAGGTRLPFIVFGISVKGHGKFGHEPLDRAMRAGAPLKGMREPAGYYPFSEADTTSVITRHVFQGITSLAHKSAGRLPFDLWDPDTACRILAAVHPYHSVLGKKHKTALAKKIRKIVKSHLKENQELADQAEEVRKGIATHAAITKLLSICEKAAGGYAS